MSHGDRGGRTADAFDPATACVNCHERAANLRCGCCGLPLCGKCHELGGGFCEKFYGVAGVPLCLHDPPAVGVRRDAVVLVVRDGDVYHLPDDDGDDTTAPACRPDETDKTRTPLWLADEGGRELCGHCEDEARQRYEESQEELAEEFDVATDGSGLYQKYVVKRTDNGKPVDGCFVLRPEEDDAARVALLAYCWATDDDELAADLQDWVDADETAGFEALERLLYESGFELKTRDLESFLEPVDDGDWTPETATLREGEVRDETSHAARNAAQLDMAEDDGGENDG